MVPNKLDIFVFGLPAFHGYYITHMMSESRISFTPLASSSKPDLETGKMPTEFLSEWSKRSENFYWINTRYHQLKNNELLRRRLNPIFLVLTLKW
jgi:hypothetical protein